MLMGARETASRTIERSSHCCLRSWCFKDALFPVDWAQGVLAIRGVPGVSAVVQAGVVIESLRCRHGGVNNDDAVLPDFWCSCYLLHFFVRVFSIVPLFTLISKIGNFFDPKGLPDHRDRHPRAMTRRYLLHALASPLPPGGSLFLDAAEHHRWRLPCTCPVGRCRCTHPSSHEPSLRPKVSAKDWIAGGTPFCFTYAGSAP